MNHDKKKQKKIFFHKEIYKKTQNFCCQKHHQQQKKNGLTFYFQYFVEISFNFYIKVLFFLFKKMSKKPNCVLTDL